MAEDFGYAWRTVRLYCPSAPTFLAREWVNAAWKQLCAARRWGFLRVERVFVADGTSWHLVLPPDFGSFRVVVDEARQVRLSTTHSFEDLVKADPGIITAKGPPCALVAVRPSAGEEEPGTLPGSTRYRYFPWGSPSTLRAIYYRQPGRLDDTTIMAGVMADGMEVLVAGALAQAALWPGTADKANPYFNAGLAQTKANEFRLGIQMLSLRDDEQYPDDLWDNWPECDCSCLGGSDPRTTDASYVY